MMEIFVCFFYISYAWPFYFEQLTRWILEIPAEFTDAKCNKQLFHQDMTCAEFIFIQRGEKYMFSKKESGA